LPRRLSSLPSVKPSGLPASSRIRISRKRRTSPECSPRPSRNCPLDAFPFLSGPQNVTCPVSCQAGDGNGQRFAF
jgi:hypothetical protein